MNTTLLLYNGTFTSISLLLYSLFQSKKGLVRAWGKVFSFILIVIHSIAVLFCLFSFIIKINLMVVMTLDSFGIAIIHYMMIGLIRMHISEMVGFGGGHE